MGGLSLGGFLMGRALRDGLPVRALCLYGTLECLVGLAGLFLNAAFRVVEQLDTRAYAGMPGSASQVHILGIAVVLGIPTICMGATLPVFGLLAGQFQVSIAELYGLNTLGAATGCLFVALVLIPLVGITCAIWIVAGINLAVCIAAWLLDPGLRVSAAPLPATDAPAPPPVSLKVTFIVFVTGFATFTLEIAWFRSLAATFPDSADIFALDARLRAHRPRAGVKKCSPAEAEEKITRRAIVPGRNFNSPRHPPHRLVRHPLAVSGELPEPRRACAGQRVAQSRYVYCQLGRCLVLYCYATGGVSCHLLCHRAAGALSGCGLPLDTRRSALCPQAGNALRTEYACGHCGGGRRRLDFTACHWLCAGSLGGRASSW